MIGMAVPSRGAKAGGFAKVISDCFFCHAQMVTSAGSSVLLRPDVAPKWSFTLQKTVMRAHKG
jgi:hypothetical protein